MKTERRRWTGSFAVWLLLSCLRLAAAAGDPPGKPEEALLQADRAFCRMAAETGVNQAFVAWADAGVILMRANAAPIVGIDALRRFYSRPDDGGTLTWDPDKAEIAASGDLGYTFGHWCATGKDKEGRETKAYGVYITVWKRQADGGWKFVFDGGNPAPPPDKWPR